MLSFIVRTVKLCREPNLSSLHVTQTPPVVIQDFIDVRGYPEWITVTRVLDGGETPLFTQYFSDWHDRDEIVVPQPNLEEEHSGDNVAGE